MCSEPLKTRAVGISRSAFTLVEVVTAICIMALVFGGIIKAYIQTTRRAEWSGYSLAAQALAGQQLEVARSGVWDPSVGKNEITNMPMVSWNWYYTNSTKTGIGYGYTTNVLDLPVSGTNYILATNYITVRIFYMNGLTNPPVQLQMVRVDTVWPFGKGKATRYFTNSVASYYAQDNRDVSTLW